MAGNNDILASAGIDVSAFEEGIAKLTLRLDAIEKAGSKAASGIEKVEKSASALKNIKIRDHLVNALGNIAGKGGEAAQAINQFDMSVAQNDFSKTGTAVDLMGHAFGRTLDVMAQLPGKYGLIGKAGSVALRTGAEINQRNIAINETYMRTAHSAQGYADQVQRIIELQKEEAMTTRDSSKLEKMAAFRDNMAKGYVEQTEEQIALQEKVTVGAQKYAALQLQLKDAEQKVADFKAKQRIKEEISPSGMKMVEAFKKQIELEKDLLQKSTAVAIKKEEASFDLAKDEATRTDLVADRLEYLEKEAKAIKKIKEEIQVAYGEQAENMPQFAELQKSEQKNFLESQQLKKLQGFLEADREFNKQAAERKVGLVSESAMLDAQISREQARLGVLEAQGKTKNEYEIAAANAAVKTAYLEKENFIYQHGAEIEQQKLTAEAQRQQSLGNQKLAQLAENRAQFEQHIADAIRNQNGELAKQLINQKALADLEAKAANLLKTPDQKAKDFQKQLEKDRALRGAAGRDFQKLSPEEQQKERDRKAEEKRKKGLPPGFFKAPAPGFKKPSPKDKFSGKGAYGFKSSEDHTSPATEEAIKGFVERNAPNIKKGAEGFLDRANNFTAKEIKTETITANKIVIKTAP